MISVILFSLVLATTTPDVSASVSPGVAATPVADVEFRLKNDTGETVRVHTGRGTSSINNGSSNRFQADVGQTFRLGSSSGPVLFEVTSAMDGETYELSDFL